MSSTHGPIRRAFARTAVAAVAAIVMQGSVQGVITGSAWLSGAALQQQLTQRINVTWAENPLRQALEGLARAKKVAIVLDRRVDPGRKIELTLSDTPLEAVLQAIGQRCQLGVSQIGAVVYLGPPAAASRLDGLLAASEESVRHLPPAAARKFRRISEMAWDDLAQPRALLAELARENGLEVEGLERIPHDLWPAADLPPLSLVERLTLIAVQFDLTFEPAADGHSFTLKPIAESPTDGRHLTLKSLPSDLSDQNGIAAPPETSKSSAARLSAPKSTSPKQSAQQPAKRASKSTAKSPPRESAAGFDQVRIERLVVQEKPIGAVLHQLAERLHLDLHIDSQAIADAGISLDQRVSATVEDGTIDAALRALLKSTGLAFHRSEGVVEIRPAK